jgi:hypothetical protein
MGRNDDIKRYVIRSALKQLGIWCNEAKQAQERKEADKEESTSSVDFMNLPASILDSKIPLHIRYVLYMIAQSFPRELGNGIAIEGIIVETPAQIAAKKKLEQQQKDGENNNNDAAEENIVTLNENSPRESVDYVMGDFLRKCVARMEGASLSILNRNQLKLLVLWCGLYENPFFEQQENNNNVGDDVLELFASAFKKQKADYLDAKLATFYDDNNPGLSRAEKARLEEEERERARQEEERIELEKKQQRLAKIKEEKEKKEQEEREEKERKRQELEQKRLQQQQQQKKVAVAPPPAKQAPNRRERTQQQQQQEETQQQQNNNSNIIQTGFVNSFDDFEDDALFGGVTKTKNTSSANQQQQQQYLFQQQQKQSNNRNNVNINNNNFKNKYQDDDGSSLLVEDDHLHFGLAKKNNNITSSFFGNTAKNHHNNNNMNEFDEEFSNLSNLSDSNHMVGPTKQQQPVANQQQNSISRGELRAKLLNILLHKQGMMNVSAIPTELAKATDIRFSRVPQSEIDAALKELENQSSITVNRGMIFSFN